MQRDEMMARVEVLKIASGCRSAGNPLSASEVKEAAKILWRFAMPTGQHLDSLVNEHSAANLASCVSEEQQNVIVLPFSWVKSSTNPGHYYLMVGNKVFCTLSTSSESVGRPQWRIQWNGSGYENELLFGSAADAMKRAVSRMSEWANGAVGDVKEIVKTMQEVSRASA